MDLKKMFSQSDIDYVVMEKSDDTEQDYGVNIFPARQLYNIIPTKTDNTEKWETLKSKYNQSSDDRIELFPKIDGKSFSLMTQVPKFSSIPAGAVSITPDLDGRMSVWGKLHPLAVMIGSTVAVYWELGDDEASDAIAKWLMDKIETMIDWTKREKKITKAAMAKILGTKLMRAYKDMSKGLEKEAKDLQEKCKDLFAKWVDTEKEYEDVKLRISANGDSSERHKKKVADFLAALEKSKNIVSFNVDGKDGITLFIRGLVMTIGEDRYDLPEYRVELGIERSNFDVFRVDGKEPTHPHVFTGHDACLGNYTTHFGKIIRNQEYEQLIDLIIEFLCSYNPESPAVDMDQFLESIGR